MVCHCLNVAVFLYQFSLGPESLQIFFYQYGQSPQWSQANKDCCRYCLHPAVFERFQQHVSSWQLDAFDRNMWFLWIFGNNIEEVMAASAMACFICYADFWHPGATSCSIPA